MEHGVGQHMLEAQSADCIQVAGQIVPMHTYCTYPSHIPIEYLTSRYKNNFAEIICFSNLHEIVPVHLADKYTNQSPIYNRNCCHVTVFMNYLLLNN